MRRTLLADLWLVLLLTLGPGSPGVRLLAVFRPRSSLTSRIHPLDEWTLPLLELQERWRSVTTPLHHDLPITTSEHHLSFTSLHREGFECFRYVDVKASEIEGIVEAARLCVLLHGLYHLYHQDTVTAIPSDAWTRRCCNDSEYYSLAGTLPTEPWIPNPILHEQWLDFWHQQLQYLGKHQLISPGPNLNYARYQIFGDPHQKYVYFCKELIRGIAAPKHGYLIIL